MNNYDLHERAQEMADTHSAYELAKRVIESEDRLSGILPEPGWRMKRFGVLLGPEFHPEGYKRSPRGELWFQHFHLEAPGAGRPSEALIRLAIGRLVEILDGMPDCHATGVALLRDAQFSPGRETPGGPRELDGDEATMDGGGDYE